MRATLIYNSAAGKAAQAPLAELLAALEGAGFEARHAPTGSEADVPAALADPGDLVCVAGGDGTLRAVALALLERPGGPVPVAPLPLGTSNNVARSLGLGVLAPLEAAGALAAPRRTPFDVGVARGPWGELRFLESFGLGLLADLLRRYDTGAPKSVLRGLQATVESLAVRRAVACRATFEGLSLEGEHLLVEVMNTPAVSNGLAFAPGAAPTDGLLELVLVGDSGLRGLALDAAALALGLLEERDGVSIHPLREVRLEWSGSPSHADALVHPGAGESLPDGTVSAVVTVLPGALEFWLPGP